MRIIALRGEGNCGKTTTLNIVYDQMTTVDGWRPTDRRQVGGDRNDFSDILELNGRKVAFYTMGDYSNASIKAIRHYQNLGVEILIMAINSRFVRPIRLIRQFEHANVEKTVANPKNTQNNLGANETDTSRILDLI